MKWVGIMKTFIFNENTLNGNKFVINDMEFNHLKNVMRLKVGDQINAVCFDDYNYISKIIEINKNNAICEVLEKQLNYCNPRKNVAVFQALLRNENLNTCVQKLTELGATTFIPFQSEFCTAKKTDLKYKKLQEISNQSIKQCGRSKPLIVEQTLMLSEMFSKLSKFDAVIFANETDKKGSLNELNLNESSNIAIIVGCEGGFSQSEKDALSELENVYSISLGKRILRAETACLALCALVLNKIGEL